MVAPKNGKLELNEIAYVVVPASDFDNFNIENLRKALAIPALNQLTIGYLLRQHRLRLNMTQLELGRRIGADQKHIDKVENLAIKRPKDIFLKKAIEVLGDDFKLGLNLIGIDV